MNGDALAEHGKHKLRNVARFRLCAHTLNIETSLWQEYISECNRCDQGGLYEEKHTVFLCACNPGQKGMYIYKLVCSSGHAGQKCGGS
eukprot:1088602-Pelagomonas_calceolata.AAC.1